MQSQTTTSFQTREAAAPSEEDEDWEKKIFTSHLGCFPTLLAPQFFPWTELGIGASGGVVPLRSEGPEGNSIESFSLSERAKSCKSGTSIPQPSHVKL